MCASVHRKVLSAPPTIGSDWRLRRPTHTASVTVVRAIASRASASATVNYVGERDDRDFAAFPASPMVLGGYATVDAAAEVRLFQAGRGGLVALTGRIENALDRRYQGVFNFAAPGRTILVGARFGGR